MKAAAQRGRSAQPVAAGDEGDSEGAEDGAHAEGQDGQQAARQRRTERRRRTPAPAARSPWRTAQPARPRGRSRIAGRTAMARMARASHDDAARRRAGGRGRGRRSRRSGPCGSSAAPEPHEPQPFEPVARDLAPEPPVARQHRPTAAPPAHAAPPEPAAPAEPPKRRSTVREPAPMFSSGAMSDVQPPPVPEPPPRRRPSRSSRLPSQPPSRQPRQRPEAEAKPRRFGWWSTARIDACRARGLIATPKPRSPAMRTCRASSRCASTPPGCSAPIRKLVLHGGGNTSVKTRAADLNGDEVDVLLRQGLRLRHGGRSSRPACPRCGSRRCTRLRTRDALSDEDFVRMPRANLIDPAAPAPSVELLLHAFMPAKFIDHTHATAVLSLTDQPNGAELCARGLRRAPGHRALRDAGLRARPEGRGRVRRRARGRRPDPAQARHLHLRGGCARSLRAHDRDGDARRGAARARPQECSRPRSCRGDVARVAEVAPILRGACSLKDETIEGAWKRFILEFRDSDAVLRFRQRRGACALRPGRRGDAGPHHPHQELAADRAGAGGRQARRLQAGRAGRGRRTSSAGTGPTSQPNNARVGGDRKRARSPAPRGAGAGPRPVRPWRYRQGRARSPPTSPRPRSTRSLDAEAIGRFESISRSRHVRHGVLAARTGQARQGARASRSPARSWRSPARAAGSAPRPRAPSRRPAPRSRCSTSSSTPRSTQAKPIGGAGGSSATSPMRRRCARRSTRSSATFGGLDIVVSNAGATPPQGKIGEVDEAVIRAELRAEFLRPPARRAGRREDHAGAGHRRLPAVQRLEAGDQSGPELRPLRPAQGRDAVPVAPVRARLRRRRHPLQRRERRPHPLRHRDRRLHQGAREGARRVAKRNT